MGTTLAQAYVQIMPSAEGMKAKIEEIMGEELPPAGESGGETLGKSLVSRLKGVIAAAGIGKMISMAISEGADLEQSIGGVETLFKENADKLKQYANEAYATAGVSANSYMEQATSFSAALIRSVGGDTQKAVEAANQALTDMADNVNKMGTPLENIQNAYQGFAKQNYTMLDNLKLGYGGTKSEMERLLADAKELTGIEYDIDNLSDVYAAIHVIQEDLGITGTTAKEAATTLSGSFASMKAAASNFLGYLTLGENIKPSLNALVKTTSTYLFDNLFPAVGNIIMALPGAIGTFITSAQPLLMQNGLHMIQSINEGIKGNIPKVLANVLPMITSFTKTMRANFGQIVDAGLDLIINIAQGLADGLPTLIQYIPTIISNIVGCINDNAPKILTAGIKIIVTLAKGMIDSIPVIIENMPKIIAAIWDTITAINWLNLGSTIISNVKNGLLSMKSKVKEAISSIGKDAYNTFKNIDWKAGGSAVITAIKNGLISIGSKIKTELVNLGKSAWTGFKSINWIDLGKNMITGIINGIRNAAGGLIDSVKSAASNALSSVKNFLGIHSPSKVFEDQVGSMISLGMANGIKENMDSVSNAMKMLSDESVGLINTDFAVNSGTFDISQEYDSNELSSILSLLSMYMPILAKGMKIVLDDDTLVAKITPKIDSKLGQISELKNRGV